MSGEQQLERSVLERKERDELHAIAEAMSLKPGSRTKKADIIDQILRATGVEVASSGDGPKADGQTGPIKTGRGQARSTKARSEGANGRSGDTASDVVQVGADVTAMGVFSDILKLLNYLPH